MIAAITDVFAGTLDQRSGALVSRLNLTLTNPRDGNIVIAPASLKQPPR